MCENSHRIPPPPLSLSQTPSRGSHEPSTSTIDDCPCWQVVFLKHLTPLHVTHLEHVDTLIYQHVGCMLTNAYARGRIYVYLWCNRMFFLFPLIIHDVQNSTVAVHSCTSGAFMTCFDLNQDLVLIFPLHVKSWMFNVFSQRCLTLNVEQSRSSAGLLNECCSMQMSRNGKHQALCVVVCPLARLHLGISGYKTICRTLYLPLDFLLNLGQFHVWFIV